MFLNGEELHATDPRERHFNKNWNGYALLALSSTPFALLFLVPYKTLVCHSFTIVYILLYYITSKKANLNIYSGIKFVVVVVISITNDDLKFSTKNTSLGKVKIYVERLYERTSKCHTRVHISVWISILCAFSLLFVHKLLLYCTSFVNSKKVA